MKGIWCIAELLRHTSEDMAQKGLKTFRNMLRLT